MSHRSTVLTLACSALLLLMGCNAPPEEPPDPAENAASTGPGSTPWQFVDTSIREHGMIDGYGDLRAGLAELEKYFEVTIEDSGDHWSVDLWPHSGEGHDYMFGVTKDTGEMVDVVIGHLFPVPPPPTGQAEGQLEALKRSILHILATRDLAVSDDVRATIASCQDAALLRLWLRQALTAASAAEAVAKTSA